MNGINSLLTKDKRHTETLKSKINELHTDYYESEHLTIGILKHLIFDFTKISIFWNKKVKKYTIISSELLKNTTSIKNKYIT